MCIDKHIYIYMYMYVCMCIYIYIYIYIYMYTQGASSTQLVDTRRVFLGSEEPITGLNLPVRA